jgi:hypothetical protein
MLIVDRDIYVCLVNWQKKNANGLLVLSRNIVQTAYTGYGYLTGNTTEQEILPR